MGVTVCSWAFAWRRPPLTSVCVGQQPRVALGNVPLEDTPCLTGPEWDSREYLPMECL